MSEYQSHLILQVAMCRALSLTWNYEEEGCREEAIGENPDNGGHSSSEHASHCCPESPIPQSGSLAKPSGSTPQQNSVGPLLAALLTKLEHLLDQVWSYMQHSLSSPSYSSLLLPSSFPLPPPSLLLPSSSSFPLPPSSFPLPPPSLLLPSSSSFPLPPSSFPLPPPSLLLLFLLLPSSSFPPPSLLLPSSSLPSPGRCT